MFFLIPSIPLPQTLGLPCSPPREGVEAAVAGVEEALEEAVFLGEVSEVEAAEVGNLVNHRYSLNLEEENKP